MPLEKIFDKLKLLPRQLVMVGTVLVLQMFLIFSLLYLLNQSEAATRRSQRAYFASEELNQLVKRETDAGLCLIAYGLSNSKEFMRRYETEVAGVRNAIIDLKPFESEFPEDSEEIQKSLTAAERVMALQNEYSDRLIYNAHDHTMGLQNLSRAIRPLLQDMSEHVVQFNEHHRIVEKEQQENMDRAKSLLRGFLIAGGMMEIFIAWASISYFRKSIISRLSVVADNAVRLPTGQPLRPRLHGVDEIAELDNLFHNMATALVDAAKKERAIIDGMPVGFMALNRFGLIEAVNPRTQSLFKVSDGDSLVGKPITQFISPPGETALTFERIQEAALGRTANFQFRRMDGTTFPAEISLNSIRASKQEVLICNILDVSERYEIERMKQEFVEIVSHDLKSPLSALQGSLHMLGHGTLGSLNDRGKELVDGMQQETKRLVRLVSDLLDIAKMEAGYIELDRQVVDVAVVIQQAVNAVMQPAKEKSIELRVDCQPMEISADPDRLIQILVNLLTNAIKFAPPKSEVTVVSTIDEETLEIKVCDQGPGVPAESQSRIFERFHQIADESRSNKDGTGLGLAICKLLVEAHGGTIGVESTAGTGATFVVKLPRKLVDSVADQSDAGDLPEPTLKN
ncbi:MAG TPA: PAS domain-containing sensor histidine kinase [Trichormus sp.]|jgi:PAS domain S-box-containing protein